MYIHFIKMTFRTETYCSAFLVTYFLTCLGTPCVQHQEASGEAVCDLYRKRVTVYYAIMLRTCLKVIVKALSYRVSYNQFATIIGCERFEFYFFNLQVVVQFLAASYWRQVGDQIVEMGGIFVC